LPSLAQFVIHEILVKAYNVEEGISFESTVKDLTKESDCGTFTFITCSLIKEQLLKVDYTLSKELIALKVFPKIAMSRKHFDSVTLYFGVANFQKGSDPNVEEGHIIVEFKLLTVDYKRMNNELKMGTKLDATHLASLLPSERCYDACTAHPGLPPPHGAPSPWPSLPTTASESPSCPSSPGACGWCSKLHDNSQHLNTEQQHVVNCVPHIDEGLYFITGPPGTGKSLMNAYVLVSLMHHYCTKRFMFAAPSNAAVNAGLYHFLALRERLLPTGFHIAFVGTPDKLPEEHRHLSASWFANDLIEPFQKSKHNWTKESDKKGIPLDIPKACNILTRKINRAVVKVEELLKNPTTIKVLSDCEVKLSKFIENLQQLNLENPPSSKVSREKLLFKLENSMSFIENERQTFEKFHLQRANVTFTTLIGSGRPFLRKCFSRIDVLLIDEAAQTNAAEVLIPMMHFSPTTTVLVGDPKQLPPVVSPAARDRGYGESLMGSFTTAQPELSWLLRDNYRMHADICRWPSQQYYDSELRTSAFIETRADIEIPSSNFCFFEHRNAFIDVSTGTESDRTTSRSYSNVVEAKAVVRTIQQLLLDLASGSGAPLQPSIGVITFYRSQVTLIRKLLDEYKKSLKDESDDVKPVI
jgi:hypothetical protein